MAVSGAVQQARRYAVQASGRASEQLPVKVPFGVVEAVNGNIKVLLRRGRGCKDLGYLRLKAQRTAALRTGFVVMRKAALNERFYRFSLSAGIWGLKGIWVKRKSL